jgi:hypothetical protein
VTRLDPGIFSKLSDALSGTGCGKWFQAGLTVSGTGASPDESPSDFLMNTLPTYTDRGDFVRGNANAIQGGIAPPGYSIVMNNQGAYFNKSKRVRNPS